MSVYLAVYMQVKLTKSFCMSLELLTIFHNKNIWISGQFSLVLFSA